MKTITNNPKSLPTIRQQIREVRSALRNYFCHVKTNVFFEKEGDSIYLSVTYEDFKPLHEVEPIVLKCLSLAHGNIQFGELSRKFSDTILKEKLLQMYKQNQLSVSNSYHYNLDSVINSELSSISFQ